MTFDGAALPKGVNPDMPKDVLYTVSEIYPEHLVLDGNHPLAGIAIRLDMTVKSVRDATEDEIGQRHRRHRLLQDAAHGAGQRPAALTAVRRERQRKKAGHCPAFS